MSEIYETPFGRMRRVAAPRRVDGPASLVRTNPWLLECPGCREWLPITDEMFVGKVSINHDADGCPGHYHETHDFAHMVYRAEAAAEVASHATFRRMLHEHPGGSHD